MMITVKSGAIYRRKLGSRHQLRQFSLKSSIDKSLLLIFLHFTKFFTLREKHYDYRKQFTLVGVGISHFTERARWALDMCKVPYQEELHGPMFHLCTTLLTLSKYSRYPLSHFNHLKPISDLEKKIYRRKELTAVPKLVITLPIQQNPELQVIPYGSGGILQFLHEAYPESSSFLYPPEIRDIIHDYERMLEKELALSVTEFIFIDLLLQSDSQYSHYFYQEYLARTAIPKIEKMWFRLLGESFIKNRMIQGNQVRKENLSRVQEKIEKVFQQMDILLKSSQTRFLLNTQTISALDITFASYAFPLLFPPQLHSYYFKRQELEEIQTRSRSTSSTLLAFSDHLLQQYQSARYVLWLYEHHRFHHETK